MTTDPKSGKHATYSNYPDFSEPRMRHPSGRPIRPPKKVDRRKWNIPDDEYQTPRLQKKSPKDAVGFVHSFPRDDED